MHDSIRQSERTIITVHFAAYLTYSRYIFLFFSFVARKIGLGWSKGGPNIPTSTAIIIIKIKSKLNQT